LINNTHLTVAFAGKLSVRTRTECKEALPIQAASVLMHRDLMLHHHHSSPHHQRASRPSCQSDREFEYFQEHAILGCATTPQLPAFASYHIRTLRLFLLKPLAVALVDELELGQSSAEWMTIMTRVGT
jgi:hypothetical protein